MKRPLETLALLTALGIVAAPAAAQTLSERIAAVRQKREEDKAQAVRALKVKMLQALLYSDVSVEFKETPAREALDYLRTSLGANMIVRWSDDPSGKGGIDPATPITLSVEKMPAIDVLELLLEQCATTEPCSWQLRASFIEVGTHERLSDPAAREVRVYPIGDLVYEPRRFEDAPTMRLDEAIQDAYRWGGFYWPGPYGNPGGFGGYSGSIRITPSGGGSGPVVDARDQNIESLIELITDVIEPAAWQRNGGTQASIHYRDGALVVHASDFIQRQIGGYPKVKPPAKPETTTTTAQPPANP
jgi:hypothetical protein